MCKLYHLLITSYPTTVATMDFASGVWCAFLPIQRCASYTKCGFKR